MTKDEYVKAYCDGCMNHSNCAYRIRGMQCHLVDNIDDIWDACETNTLDKACEIISKSIREWNWHYRFNEFSINEDATIAKFKQAMVS